MLSRRVSSRALLRLAAGPLLAVVLSSPAAAWLTSVGVEPPAPTTGDSVVIRVAGEFPDPCWSVISADCGKPRADSLEIVGNVSGDPPGSACIQVVTPYTFHCGVGFLDAGRYRLTVIQRPGLPSIRLPDVMTLTFEVQAMAATRSVSWGTMRVLYR